MLIKPLIENVKGTMIDSNYFDGARSNTQAHLATAKANGFDKAGPIDILDSEGEIALSVKGGYHLKTFITGAKLADYDSLISVVRFKGHNLPRYGGSMKNLSICLGTPKGAAQIHSGGKIADYFSSAGEKVTSESMADASKLRLISNRENGFSSTSLICLSLKDVMLVTEQRISAISEYFSALIRLPVIRLR